jgi:hypothetical protein
VVPPPAQSTSEGHCPSFPANPCPFVDE